MISKSHHSTYKFCYDQDRIDELAADRKLETNEIHPANDFYGQASVIKRYCRLPESYQLKSVVEHGVMYTDEMWHYDKEACLASNLAFSHDRAEIQRKDSGKPSIAIGSGFHYAKGIVDREQKPVDRMGTIAFPCHSSHTIQYVFDYEDYADKLVSLPSWMQPVYVCMYWKDILSGKHKPYVDRGLPIVTAGHMFDRDFLIRSYDICRRFQYAVGNDIGSYLYNAVSSGCVFFYLHSSLIEIRVPETEVKNVAHGREDYTQLQEYCARLFAAPYESLSPEQEAFINRFVGMDCVKSPEELRAVLKQTEKWDKTRRVVSPHSATSQTLALPPYFHRKLVRPARLVRKIGRSIGKRVGLVKRTKPNLDAAPAESNSNPKYRVYVEGKNAEGKNKAA